tara:strand:- start:384 stop:674 length:291 start_codon:yes stop_codon:yes gene_type:complete
MKIHLKFNHKKKDVLEAIDCQSDNEQVNYQISRVIQKYNQDDSAIKSSQLAEMIHNDLDYEIILFLATKALEEKMYHIKFEEMKDEFKKFLSDEDI